MPPDLTTAVLANVLKVLRTFVQSTFLAVVPLVTGLVGGVVATAFFVALLSGQTLTGFFSAASNVDIGLLVALIVNTVTATTSSRSREGRAGTVALVTIGMIATLIGQLTIGSVPVKGILFAVTWGGITAGVLGLVFLVREAWPDRMRATPQQLELRGKASEDLEGMWKIPIAAHLELRGRASEDLEPTWKITAAEELDPAARFSIRGLRDEVRSRTHPESPDGESSGLDVGEE